MVWHVVWYCRTWLTVRWRSGGSPGTGAPTPAATTAYRPYSHTRAAAPTQDTTWGTCYTFTISAGVTVYLREKWYRYPSSSLSVWLLILSSIAPDFREGTDTWACLFHERAVRVISNYYFVFLLMIAMAANYFYPLPVEAVIIMNLYTVLRSLLF